MNKNDFLLSVAAYLELLGYRKFNDYWFLRNDQLVYCVLVQGAQWDTDDYYVDVGIAIRKDVGSKPAPIKWYVRKRCMDDDRNDRNIPLSALISGMAFFEKIHTVNELKAYVEHTTVGFEL